jgi:hypothetical protein
MNADEEDIIPVVIRMRYRLRMAKRRSSLLVSGVLHPIANHYKLR